MDSIPSWPFVVRNSRRSFFGVIALWTTLALHSRGCDLCAIYSAGGARGESRAGFHFTVAEEFIPFRTPQSEGHEVAPATPDYLDRSITHFVPAYNFSGRFGVGLNVPVIYRRFQRSDFRYSLTGQVFETNRVSEFDLGDIALVSRFTLFQRNRMKYGVAVNLLAGVKFPTGDTDRLKDEVEQTRIFDARQTPGTTHDPLGHSSSGIHQHDLSSGSGSFDGIFGLTLNSRWLRCFFNSQFQYYLRTEAESFQYGDDLIVSGGAGYYVLLDERCTLSVQALATYETEGRDRVLGRKSDRTGMTAWFVGPQVTFTWSNHLSANAGADLPVRIANNGFQYVPDYRFHGGFTWRF